jgi:beta-mannosidase
MIDTLAEIYLNGTHIGVANNMHRVWKFPVKGILQVGENELCVKISSPSKYIKEKNAERALWGVVDTTMPGYQYIRKAHYMFGWDWGPQLPDMGIYRSVYLYDEAQAYINNFKMKQIHEENKVILSITPEIAGEKEIVGSINYVLRSPSGDIVMDFASNHEMVELCIVEPQLWWPNGYGKANLYQLSIQLFNHENEVIDQLTQNIGLRMLNGDRSFALK